MKRYIRSTESTNYDILTQYQNSYTELEINVGDKVIEVYNPAEDTTCSMDFRVDFNQIPTREFERILRRCVETVQ